MFKRYDFGSTARRQQIVVQITMYLTLLKGNPKEFNVNISSIQGNKIQLHKRVELFKIEGFISVLQFIRTKSILL